MTPSYLLKLARAERHLAEFDGLVADFARQAPPPALEVQDTGAEGDARYVYRLALSRPPDDWPGPLVAGDVLFNLRSALDHIAVVLAAGKRSVTFPITSFDIDEVDATGRYRHSDARRSFRNFVNGIPDDAVAVIKQAQPYNAARPGEDPKDHCLAVLRLLQNADKHRGLLAVAPQLVPSLLLAGGELVPVARRTWMDGEVVHRSAASLGVRVEGTSTVRLGPTAEHTHDFGVEVRRILDFIRTDLLVPLADFL